VIQLRILGPTDLRTADGRELRPVLQQPKRLALLAYLALAGPHHFRQRDTILGLFWPELDEDHSRRALRQALRFLRGSLDAEVITERGRDELALDPAGLWCDAVECLHRLDAGELEEALALYRGDLLGGLLVSDAAPELEQWMAAERTTLRRRVAEAARALSERSPASSDTLGWIRRAVELAPDDEAILRRLVLVLEEQGNRMGALKAYDEFAARLIREFDAEPSRETRAVIDRIRTRDERPRETLPPSAPVRPAETIKPALAAAEPPSTRPRPGHLLMMALGGLAVAGILLTVSALTSHPDAPLLGRRDAIAVAPELERWPALSPDGATLYYTISSAAGDELYAQQVNGDNPVPLTSHLNGSQRFGAISPDGRTLLFSSDDGLYLMPALGGQARRLVEERSGTDNLDFLWVLPGAWSPDGRRVVYPDHDTLYVQDVDGAGRTAVASGVFIHSPAWSPDGDWIAYVQGNPGFHFRGNIAPSEIRIVPSRGGRSSVLADATALNTSPVWVPGRRELLFISDREGGRDIYMLRLRRNGEPEAVPARITTGLNPDRLSLSADGRRLAWSVFSETANIRSIAVQVRDSVPLSEAPLLTSGNQIVEAVGNISPDGEWLYYHSDRSGNPDLWRIQVAGGHPVQLTTDPAGDFAPQVSPDGKEVVFHSLRTGSRQIFVMPAAGGAAVQVSHGSENAGPYWTPDGAGLTWGSGGWVMLARRGPEGSWSAPTPQWKYPAGVGGSSQWAPHSGRISVPVPEGIEVTAPGHDGRRVLTEGAGIWYHTWADDERMIFGGRIQGGHLVLLAIPVDGSPASVLAYADHPEAQLPRYGIAYNRGRLYFPLAERASDIWIGELRRGAR
jgi:serine/threonine-protein kinase